MSTASATRPLLEARELIDGLSLAPHPEGGWYREVYRSATRVETPRGARSAITTIHYLLESHQLSRWHVVEADEIWHFYSGAPLELLAYDAGSRRLSRHMLGNAAEGNEPAAVIERGVWQAARSVGAYSLVGCTVGPGFEFDDFRFVATLPGHAEHFAGELAPFAQLL
jgi:predicted cupin superfamily sugar epimerase